MLVNRFVQSTARAVARARGVKTCGGDVEIADLVVSEREGIGGETRERRGRRRPGSGARAGRARKNPRTR